MGKNYSLYYLYVVFFLIFSVFTGVYINSFLIIWLIFEFNLLMFLFLVYLSVFVFNSMMLIYYIIQSLSSLMILFSGIYFDGSLWLLYLFMFFMVKLGVPPFHYWFIYLLKELDWLGGLILMTGQKFLPLLIFYQLMLFNNLMFGFMVIFMIFMFKSLNFINLKVLIGYSSIVQTYWLILSMYFSSFLFINYLFIYLINVGGLVSCFYLNGMKNLLDIFFVGYITIMILLFMGISSMGMPMSMTFIIKLMIFEVTVLKNFFFILIMLSSLFMMVYIRLMINSFMLNSFINKLVIYNVKLGGLFFLLIFYISLMYFLPMGCYF
uniref:NADH-ubiquinone oxidoreductase chain 2 n=1 Tax=Ceraphronidae sp. ZJUH_2016007 TaxID=2491153 RepID=A0A3S8V0H5_9HYME|nr:NADH dehydrogenase subunit 2 [Ceraphronidae sp. ZJUH_2016007]